MDHSLAPCLALIICLPAGGYKEGKKHGPGMYKAFSGSWHMSKYQQGKEVGEGVRWSQGHMWRMVDGNVRKSQGSISDDESVAMAIAAQIGVDPTEVIVPPPSPLTYSQRVTSQEDMSDRSFTSAKSVRLSGGDSSWRATPPFARPIAPTRAHTTPE